MNETTVNTELAGRNNALVRPQVLADALRSYQQGNEEGLMVYVSRQACDEGAYWLERLNQETEIYRYELERSRAQMDSAVKLLSGIHALLYPSPIETNDGKTMVFRPNELDPHEVLQELSDRIRALPDELRKLKRPND